MKKTMVALTLSAALVSACNSHETDKVSLGNETNIPTEQESLSATSLVIESINKVNNEVSSSQPISLLFAKNVCIAWPIPEGYNIVRNPVIYRNNSASANISLMLIVNNYSNISNGPFSIDFNNSENDLSIMNEVITPAETNVVYVPTDLGKISLRYENNSGWMEDEFGNRYAETFPVSTQNFKQVSNLVCPDSQIINTNTD